MTAGFGPGERRELDRGLDRDGEVLCPRCGTPVERRRVRPRPDVSYVRDRIWVVCGGCGGSAVFDRRRVEGAEEKGPAEEGPPEE